MSDKKEKKEINVNFDFQLLNNNTDVIKILMGDSAQCPNCGTSKSKHCHYWGNNAFKCFRCGYSINAYSIALEKSENKVPIEAIKFLADTINGNNLQLKKSKAYRVKPIATPDILDKLYSFLIENSKLSRKDFNYLRSRGLNKDEIESRKFRSADSIKNTFKLLFEKDSKLTWDDHFKNVPGVFYDNENKVWDFNVYQGIIIPVSNNGFIKGFQVRTDNPQMRYIWISSTKKNGTGPGAPFDEIHTSANNKKALITEGVFKSIAVERLNRYEYIFSVQGIGNTKKVIKYINKLHSEDKLDKIDLAFDMDVTLDKEHQGNKLIKDFANNLTFNIDKNTLIWDEEYKGIDDIPKLENGTINTKYIKRRKTL